MTLIYAQRIEKITYNINCIYNIYSGHKGIKISKGNFLNHESEISKESISVLTIRPLYS